MRRTFRAEVPPEVCEAVQSHMKRWEVVLPPWCQEVIVDWDVSLDKPAKCTVQEEYRQMIMVVGPELLMEAPASRDTVIRHEFVHALIAPVMDFMDDLVAWLKLSGPERTFVNQIERRALERVTVDITEVLGRLRA